MSASIDQSRRTAITEAVARVAPAVVTVQTETVERGPSDPFEAFFGGRSGMRVLPGLGSGFITRTDGVIVTNAHVVVGATRISVALPDGTSFPAQLLGADTLNDLAVLKIGGRNLPVAKLGNSNDLMVGEWAIAIGNPFGFMLGNSEPSVTAGVISGTGRNLATRAEGPGIYVDMIQTDASINPGNSGGPLINAVGEVIGVNSSIFSPSGGSVGLGFAIPINRVKRVTEDLLAHGTIRRPWVGLKVETPRAGTTRAHRGAVVSSVVPGSPAAQAGLRPGDVLVRSRDREIQNAYDWEAELLELRVGERAPVQLRRDGREITVNLVVADQPEVSAPKVAVLRELELVTLTPQIRADRSVVTRRGALIYRVSDRVAADLGIQAGDVIVQINRTPIESADDAARAIDMYGGRGLIRMYYERRGQLYFTDFIIR
ncbi:MAG: trypsin-like peptidase domain-containing protein [Gemmatimonadaceae bacterium]